MILSILVIFRTDSHWTTIKSISVTVECLWGSVFSFKLQLKCVTCSEPHRDLSLALLCILAPFSFFFWFSQLHICCFDPRRYHWPLFRKGPSCTKPTNQTTSQPRLFLSRRGSKAAANHASSETRPLGHNAMVAAENNTQQQIRKMKKYERNSNNLW